MSQATRPATQPARAPTRPTLTEQQYQVMANELRAAYTKPQDQWPAATVEPGVEFREIGSLPPVEHPESNPFSKEKADLGKMLFFDPRLSGSGQMACASCHDPDLGWTDGRTVAFGHDRQALKRNSPTLLNSGHNTFQFWDGRAQTLEEQAVMPILADDEMRAAPEVVVSRIATELEYRKAFRDVFGDEKISLDRIAKALATFQRTIVGGRSQFDQFLGGKKQSLSDEAIRGLHLFRTEARCINCHSGPNFTDNQFHDLGLSYFGRKLEDLGRYNATRRPEDVGKFKTPTLRNITRTPPYMHNGLFDLDGVLNMYNAGMPTLTPTTRQAGDAMFPTKSHLLKELNLSRQELEDLRAFLASLEEPRRRVRAPDLPGMSPATTPPAAEAGEGD
jgi:cytochrome c peroxidase